MWRFFGAMLLVGAVIYAIKLAALVLILGGLIFRTKQTIGLIGLFAILAGLSKAPIPTLIGLGSLMLIGAILRAKEKRKLRALLPAADNDA